MKDKHYFSLLLHAHLPYVHHPEQPSYLEENWLYEAISETYIPLLQILERLERDQVPCRLAISLSSTLLAMLDHPNLQARYLDYLRRQSELCQTLIQNWRCSTEEKALLQHYLQFYQDNYVLFQHNYRCELIPSFRRFRDKGMLELICTAATHAFLPNFQQYPALVRQQIRLAIATFEKYFGCLEPQDSLGFWLPECGYYDGLDRILVEEGVRYCYIALHGLLGSSLNISDNSAVTSSHLPRCGSFAPVQSPEGLILFPRERASSAIIWDQQIGFPAAKAYRDFYQDVGYRADIDVVRPHLPFGLRYYTGIKLWRIERLPGGAPCAYEKDNAVAQARDHAVQFLQNLSAHSRQAASLMPRTPLISTVYDAELFGHWWNEGPVFLEQLLRRNHEQRLSGQSNLEFVTPSEYLQRESRFQILHPCFSSWGKDGYAQVWLDQKNDWIYPQLFELYENIEMILAQRSMQNLNQNVIDEYGLYQQEAIKLLICNFSLACASDWAFMMKSDTSKDYAIVRTNEHIQNASKILQGFVRKKFDSNWLMQLRQKNRIFLDLDIENFFLYK